ncbi:MarR family transcriptional regulator [Sphingomonas ginkgonis]|uniref:MarR family transcriptional regulator n=1 Tax=Sphingomonas ginkgonis TaxID=2315330 RepID=A0A3R9Y7P7_9SPHN|nr:MarR family transcriptional regulator [Sphingomonas ginkgonis]RST31928.1 MarR family transcriptional regulator [Sphingomonas ginkgonis]
MFPNASPQALAARFTTLAEVLVPATSEDRAAGNQRKLLAAIAATEPATLGAVAERMGRGAPAMSRAVDALVRAGLVERTPDPDNRRQLQLRLSDDGRALLQQPPATNSRLAERLSRVAQSELRALERALEILERMPR